MTDRYGNNRECWFNIFIDNDLRVWTDNSQITVQPGEGATLRVYVTAEGDGLTYLWESFDGTKWVKTSFATSKTDTLSIKITEARDGKQYRCVVTDQYGAQVISEAATLTVSR